jgi:hypothetical protein
MQITVNDFQNLNKILRVAAIQVFQFPDRIKTVAAESVVAEVFHPVTVVAAVETDIAGGFPVFAERVQEVTTHAPLSRNIMPENIQPVICPF